jgi:hypothetical protein
MCFWFPLVYLYILFSFFSFNLYLLIIKGYRLQFRYASLIYS